MPSWGPSGSEKSYDHCPNSAAGSDDVERNVSVVTPGYDPAIYSYFVVENIRGKL